MGVRGVEHQHRRPDAVASLCFRRNLLPQRSRNSDQVHSDKREFLSACVLRHERFGEEIQRYAVSLFGPTGIARHPHQ